MTDYFDGWAAAKQAEDAEFAERAAAWRRQWEHLPQQVAKANALREMYARWAQGAA